MSILGLVLSLSSAHAKTQRIEVTESESELIQLDTSFSEIYVSDKSVLSVRAPSNTSVLVTAKTFGRSDVVLTNSQGKSVAHFSVNVKPNLSILERSISVQHPDAKVRLRALDEVIIVEGEAQSPIQAHEILNIVQGFARSLADTDRGNNEGGEQTKAVEGTAIGGGGAGYYENVVNKLKVAGSDQINISVRIVEMERSTSEQLGLRWNAIGEYLSLGVSPGNKFNTPTVLGNNQDTSINGIIDALVENSLVSVLAEPNLTAKSGEAATFMSGGEYPVPVDNSDEGVSIEFKRFGISLELTPTLLDGNRISLTVSPEISNISRENSVTLNGVEVPGIDTRKTTTTVELADGQSFALAGLIRTYRDQRIEALPILGELPIIAPFFSTNSYVESESELVIIATARLVEPTSDPLALSTPLDQFKPPSRFERLWFGEFEKQESTQLFGEYGFDY
ncbi:type II and III secretion system protein family protein [Vibrio sp. S9_S30]|nr:type II and III secretion system protein family protein [Vibrio sp. S9_S30]